MLILSKILHCNKVKICYRNKGFSTLQKLGMRVKITVNRKICKAYNNYEKLNNEVAYLPS